MKTNKFKISRIIILIGITVLGYSCANSENKYALESEHIMLEDTGETPVLSSIESGEQTKEATLLDSDRMKTKKNNVDATLKIIKNANCRIKVKDVEKATVLAKKIALKYQGYISDERFTNTNYTKENRFTIRIPQDQFDTVLDSVCGLAEFVDYKNISTVDVTEEYIDITSRLQTKLDVKERYETILRTRAKTVEDILKTEEKLSLLQEEIESAQGRLKYLSNKVSYSTIQVDVYQTIIPKDEPVGYKPHFLDKAKQGLSFGWSIIENLTLLLFYIWPLLVLGSVIFVYFKWIRK
ncbi:hypothetical protein IWQ47_002627 [Aquimarina sp. EL_43]|uniref:DUF4349 domain-containing protein n=1 Tax=unclassified Aquimarina TaxID=2627091 RepID=UPI0018CB582D|nr:MULTISPECIES: DUF4349 domain-containing protein [unclassified Aquimarina]MBG6131157.1 hypothetical protein [Aquimarina sp. EL_35]MBG6151616.1 hypothetical protein [Aquimarina sp. EL_32]MBG6169547.1 hypothetical protein [Aquimarina sp. EL_43]